MERIASERWHGQIDKLCIYEGNQDYIHMYVKHLKYRATQSMLLKAREESPNVIPPPHMPFAPCNLEHKDHALIGCIVWRESNHNQGNKDVYTKTCVEDMKEFAQLEQGNQSKAYVQMLTICEQGMTS